MSPRPGFVLEVDRSTPATLMWHGEGFRLEKLPVGTRVVYGPEPLPALRDPDGVIREALDHPLGDSQPLRSLLFSGMRLTIAFDDISLPLPPMRAPDARQRVIEAVLDLAEQGSQGLIEHLRERLGPATPGLITPGPATPGRDG